MYIVSSGVFFCIFLFHLLVFRNLYINRIFEAVNNQRNLEDTYLIKEETKKLLSALRQVKHPYGQVFWLRAYEEMSFKEIGEIFDKSENWARVNYFRAKTKIRKVIEDEKIK